MVGLPLGLDRLAPEAKDLFERDVAAIAGIEKLRFFPLMVESAKGSTLTEAGGRQLIDLTATWTAAGLGYGHPAVVEALTRVAKNPPGMGLSVANPEAVGLAEDLLRLVPGSGARKVYIGHSGSDACDVVLRAIRHNMDKKRIVAFEHSYHGGLGLAMGVSGVHVDTGAVAPDSLTTFVRYPNPYRPPSEAPTAEGALEASIAELKRACAGGDVACVIAEPILDDGGLVVPPPGFLKRLEELCHRYDVLLVCDEVKVGLGRTGMLHAFQLDGVIPDVVCFGKVIGNGLPLSAAVGPAALLDNPPAAALLTTAGNPISCAVGRAVLKTIVEDELPERARRAGIRMREALSALDHPCIGDVRGHGLAIGVELVGDRESKSIDRALTAATVYRAFELGVAVFSVGPNVLEITPPLVITDEEIDRSVEILGRAIADAAAGLVPTELTTAYAGW